MIVSKRIGLWLCMAAAVLFTGCETMRDVGIQVSTPKKAEPTSTRTRVELEYIPNATRVRLDTRPKWPNGRYAFQRGTDRLFVMSRITSIEDENGVRYDKIVERVWVTLPLEIGVGDRQIIEEMETDFLIGYEEGDGREMWIQPFRSQGNLTILEERPNDSVVLQINMVLYPGRLTEWRYVDTVQIPMSPDGVLASSVRPEQEPLVLTNKPVENLTPPPLRQTVVTNVDDPMMSNVDDAGEDMESEEASGPPDPSRSVAGRWSAGSDETGTWKFQFEPDGVLIYTTQRPGYPAYMHYGTYQIKADNVVLFVKSHGSNVDWRTTGPPYSFLKYRFDGDKLVLRGELNHRGAAQKVSMKLRPGGFPDMRLLIPQKIVDR